jgi:hypothetical protein
MIGNINKNSKYLEARYSTLEDYVKSVNSELKSKLKTLPVYKGDFFPIQMQHSGSYWTGYFTTRPNFKKFVRQFSGLALSSASLYAFDLLRDKAQLQAYSTMTTELLRNYALTGHHDTITGTSWQWVIERSALTSVDVVSLNDKYIESVI